MNFLNPLFLFGLAAASIPIIIHLFTRRRPREVKFPSLEFLTEVNQSEIRRLRLRQWLLLLLRALAVAALALAMARPALRGSSGGGRAATTVVALLDRSGSMTADGLHGPVFLDARRAVEDLFTTLGPADELLLVPYDDQVRPVTPRPSSDLPRLRAALQGLEPSARTTDHDLALAFAARALSESHALNRELFWISDFQRAGFHAGADREGAGSSPLPAGAWNNVRTYLLPTPPVSRANAALLDASLAPAENGAALSVTGASYGASAGDRAVQVTAGGAEIGRGFLNLPSRGQAATLLPLSAAPETGGVAHIPDDALALDNVRYFAAGRAGTLRVLLREDGPPSPLALALAAGSPASGLAVERVDAAHLAERLAEADVLVLSGLERLGPAELQAVLDYARAGGPLFVALDERSDAEFWNGSLLRELGAGTLGPVAEAPEGSAWRLSRVVPVHPVLAGFPARPGEPLSSARFQRVRAFTPGSRGRALLEYDAAHAALVETPHALFLIASLSPDASDFAVSGAFLPLVHQIVKVVARGSAAASYAPGDRYGAPASTGAWRIEDSNGNELASELRADRGTTRLQSAPIEAPGLYRVLQNGRLRSSFAVNVDAGESDLEPLPEPELLGRFPAGRASVLHPGADLARRVREARYGRELWSWFVTLALLLLVAETLLGRWGLGTPARPADSRAA
ncbi:MAG TPA: BatA domain-containing protein [Candidatus Sulfotelmatobacter sp.]|nr:BatA domain-containing protein [Candidatus Sulfotelmatobacter sp.]